MEVEKTPSESQFSDHDRLREETPATYYEERVKIAGMGEAPNRCRPMKPVGFCERGHTILGRSSCGTRECPDHYRDSIEEAVITMVARMAAFRHVADGAGKRWHHLVASPPQDRRYTVEQLWNTRTDAYDALEAAGVRGGATVTHPYRTNDRGDMLYETATESGDVPEDQGRWSFLRELSDDWEEMTQYIEAAPHYHCLGAAKDVDSGEVPGDWIVKRIQTMRPFFYRDTMAYRDMVAPAYYVLTHGAVQEGRRGTTYFGEMHPASFDPEEELTAAVWSRIQMEAEKAVKTRPGEEIAADHGPEECPCEGCEADVIDVMHLPEYMQDDDWVAHVRNQRHGRARYNRLMGVLLWWEGRCDTPPPGVVTSEAQLREWLEDNGNVHTAEARQVSITTAVM
jgi:hypothetical protein